jgi:hypothetical protein
MPFYVYELKLYNEKTAYRSREKEYSRKNSINEVG